MEAGLLHGLLLCLSNEADPGRRQLEHSVLAEPDNAAWRSDRGFAFLLLGRLQEALNDLKAAVTCSAADAVAFGRLGGIQVLGNELEKAEENFLEAIRRDPNRAEWHNNLGGILVRQQKLEESLEYYKRALRLNPDLSQAQQSMHQVLTALERSEEIIADLLKAMEKNPDDYTVKLRLARAYNVDNRPADAIKLLREALLPLDQIEISEEGAPSDIYTAQLAYRRLMAEIFTGRAMHARALMVLNQMAKMQPDNMVPVVCSQAFAYSEMGRYEKALEILDAIEKDFPGNHQIETSRANVLCEKGDYQQAEGILRHLIETYPGDAGLLSQLGNTLLWVGDLAEAVDCFERASEINPVVLAQLVNANKIPDDPRVLEKMQALADNPLLPDVTRESMNFALSKVYDKGKDYDASFHYLFQANRLVDKSLTYNPDVFTQRTQAVMKVFGSTFFDALPCIRKSDRTPVFVLGMPRSGTTLTEQILSAHPDIFGAGELSILVKLTSLMPRVLKAKKQFPWCMFKMTPALREEAARHYLYRLYEYDRDHAYVVDKMPHNFVQLGLIATIFPTARIIHVNRDPRDIAVSNYQQNFKARHGGMGFSYNLKNIAFQINDYHKLMNHWRNVLPLPIFDLSYEAMVGDMEGTAKKLLDFVGVPWNEDVKQFHASKRAVRTASVTQVRQPIYKTSMKKWKRYEKHLDDLLDHLNPEVTGPYDNFIENNNPYVSRIVYQGRIVPFKNR